MSKVHQLSNLLTVRHSVMVLGSSGSGKTSIWTALLRQLNFGSTRPTAVYEVVNPKCVTSDELYGHLTLARVRQLSLRIGRSEGVRRVALLGSLFHCGRCCCWLYSTRGFTACGFVGVWLAGMGRRYRFGHPAEHVQEASPVLKPPVQSVAHIRWRH